LDTILTELETSQPGKAGRLVFMICGEFGRQLAANGDYGTDHGIGNFCLLVGDRVNGGLHGEMFPTSEIPRFGESGTDIEGRTSFLQVIGRVCEQLKTGGANAVVPGWQTSPLETGVDLSNLFV